MNYRRKLRRNVKAISPVISVLLMIAVAVAASLVTYAWVMGYLGFTTNKVGKAIQIQSVAKDGTVYVQNVGDSTLTMAEAYLDGSQVTGTWSLPTIAPGETTWMDVNGASSFAGGQTVVVKATTEDGTFAELTKTFP
jgi:flagellin-like protein